MTGRLGPWCETFVTEHQTQAGHWEVQWQFPSFTITLTANSLRFAAEVADFVKQTRDNPDYRDVPLGDGVFRYMPEKSVDLSTHFEGARLHLQKLGVSDHSYQLDVCASDGLRLTFRLYDGELDAFLSGIEEIIEDWLPNAD